MGEAPRPSSDWLDKVSRNFSDNLPMSLLYTFLLLGWLTTGQIAAWLLAGAWVAENGIELFRSQWAMEHPRVFVRRIHAACSRPSVKTVAVVAEVVTVVAALAIAITTLAR